MNTQSRVLPLSVTVLALYGCASSGGGGGADPVQPASQESQPVELISHVVTTTPLDPGVSGMVAGTFDAIGISLSDWDETANRNLRVGELRVQVDPESRTYTLTFDRADLPEALAFEFSEDFGMEDTATDQWSDGTSFVYTYPIDRDAQVLGYPEYVSPTPGRKEYMTVTYALGLSYVSLGSWSRTAWDEPLQAGDADEYAGRDDVYFVYGLRTEQLPVSGTATYRSGVQSINVDSSGSPNSALGAPEFQVDFGRSLIVASIVRTIGFVPYWDHGGGQEIYADVSVTGNASLGVGSAFTIPMAGTFHYSHEAYSDFSVHGQIDGAFFGPNAEQIGGTFHYLRDNVGDQPPIVGAFIGTRTGP